VGYGETMLTHIVFMKFPTLEVAEQVQQKLLALEGNIPSLRSIEAGLDITRSGRSWDLALLTRFDDQAGLDAYAIHPKHVDVLTFIKANVTEVAAVDYQ
jgi:hypothetical protein